MKTIQKEKVQKYDVYVANDGTEFADAAECKKYEESARGVLSVKIKEIVVKDAFENNIVSMGCEDCHIKVLKPRNEGDADAIMQMFLLVNSWATRDGHEDCVKHIRSIIKKAVDEKDYLIVRCGCDDDDFWPDNTRNSLKEKIDTFFQFEEKENA